MFISDSMILLVVAAIGLLVIFLLGLKHELKNEREKKEIAEEKNSFLSKKVDILENMNFRWMDSEFSDEMEVLKTIDLVQIYNDYGKVLVWADNFQSNYVLDFKPVQLKLAHLRRHDDKLMPVVVKEIDGVIEEAMTFPYKTLDSEAFYESDRVMRWQYGKWEETIRCENDLISQWDLFSNRTMGF